MKLVAIVGPTAVGKSQLALFLARLFQGEIVNADSRQVYRYMDIGTAKPSLEERKLVPHHLIDIVNPDEEFNLAIYQDLAYRTIAEIHERGRLPILVGGSGLYVWAVLEGWQIPATPPNHQLRRELESKARAEGCYALYHQLMKIDPLAAKTIDPRNIRRVIRALEVSMKGIPISQLWKKDPPPLSPLIIGLTMERRELYHRIDARVEYMIKLGWVEEVKKLLERGYALNLPSLSSLGYKEIGKYVMGEIDLSTAIQHIKVKTHQFARRQYAWFKLSDPRIKWLEATEEVYPITKEEVERFLDLKTNQIRAFR